MLKKLFLILFLISVPVLLPAKTFASLYINEFSSDSSPEWVEIYNSDSSSVDLSNYVVRDSTDEDSHKIDLSGSISGNGFATFDWSGNSSVLNNPGDTIRLLSKTTNEGGVEPVINQVVYGVPGDVIAPKSGQTAGRSPDGSSNWVILAASSKGASNNSSGTLPTPTITPTSAPTPTKTPTPTKSPTSAPASSSTPTNSPVVTNGSSDSTVIESPTPDDSSSDLSLASDNNSSDPFKVTPTDGRAEVLGASTSNVSPVLFIGIGLIFLAVCGILAYFQFGSKIFIWKKKSL